jgi:hypothetical protein
MIGTWPAYYGGRCTNCDVTFKAGTMVRWDGGKVVHDECDPAAISQAEGMGPKERKVYRDQMCLRCFMVHAPGQQECA